MFMIFYRCDEMECPVLWQDRYDSNLSLNPSVILPFQFFGQNKNQISCFGKPLGAVERKTNIYI